MPRVDATADSRGRPSPFRVFRLFRLFRLYSPHDVDGRPALRLTLSCYPDFGGVFAKGSRSQARASPTSSPAGPATTRSTAEHGHSIDDVRLPEGAGRRQHGEVAILGNHARAEKSATGVRQPHISLADRAPGVLDSLLRLLLSLSNVNCRPVRGFGNPDMRLMGRVEVSAPRPLRSSGVPTG